MSDESQNRFSGLARRYGEPGLAALRQAHVAVIGIGGVGSWSAEALARSGVGGTHPGRSRRCLCHQHQPADTCSLQHGGPIQGPGDGRTDSDHQPGVHPTRRGLLSETGNDVETLLDRSLDGVIDAVRPKCLLLAECHRRQIPVLTCGAAGGRSDATLIEIADLSRIFNDALLHQVRKNLRGNYGFPSGEDSRKKFGIAAVFSPEETRYPQGDGCVSTERPTP